MGWFVVGRPIFPDFEEGEWKYKVKRASSDIKAVQGYVTVCGPFTKEEANIKKQELDADERRRASNNRKPPE